MPASSPPRPLRPKSILNLSISSSDISIPVQEALFEDSTHYDALLHALRDATSHTRTRLSAAIELADVMETARTALKTIRTTLDDPLRVNPWSPNKYDSNKLEDPGSDPTDPDCYFSKHATPKARVLFRITSGSSNTGTSNTSNSSDTLDTLSTLKIYARVKRLNHQDRLKLCSLYDSEESFDPEDYHLEISQWVARFAKRLETKTEGQDEPYKAGSGKRKQANANPPSKRKAIRASSNQATLPAAQPPNVPYRRNSTQIADATNQNMLSYQNQPAQQTVQQDTFRMDNLANFAATAYQEGLVTQIPGLYYQEQQSSPDSALQKEGQHRQEHGQQQGRLQEEQQGQHQGQLQQEQEQEQQSMGDAGLGDLVTDETGNEFYPEFLFQYNTVN